MRNRRGKEWEREQPTVDMHGKELPRHIKAEASVLGGILLHNEALAYLSNTETEDFYDFRHKVVFTAMRNLEASSLPIDLVTLENEIEKVGKLDAIGGVGFLGELALEVPTVDNIEAYADIIRTKRVTRSVLVMIGDVITESRVDGREGEQLIHDITTALLMISSASDRPIVTMADLIAEEADRISSDLADRAAGKRVVAGIPTGITMLDEKVGGHPLATPTLYIARPACGKTTLAMMASSAAAVSGHDSLLASYEDRGQSFGQRGLGQSSGIATDLIRARRLTPDDVIALMAGRVASNGRREMFLAASGLSAEALVRRLRRENLRRKHSGHPPIKQLLVDYVQKMPQPEHTRSRDEGISHIMNVLSTSAVEENLALVVYAQLNREIEKRDDHRPRLSDIRDSGSLEQDGKLILGLYRPWLYEPNKYPEHELHVLGLKNHNGESMFDILLWWDVKCHAVYNSQMEYGAARNIRAADRPMVQSAIPGHNRFDDVPFDQQDWNRK